MPVTILPAPFLILDAFVDFKPCPLLGLQEYGAAFGERAAWEQFVMVALGWPFREAR